MSTYKIHSNQEYFGIYHEGQMFFMEHNGILIRSNLIKLPKEYRVLNAMATSWAKKPGFDLPGIISEPPVITSILEEKSTPGFQLCIETDNLKDINGTICRILEKHNGEKLLITEDHYDIIKKARIEKDPDLEFYSEKVDDKIRIIVKSSDIMAVIPQYLPEQPEIDFDLNEGKSRQTAPDDLNEILSLSEPIKELPASETGTQRFGAKFIDIFKLYSAGLKIVVPDYESQSAKPIYEFSYQNPEGIIVFSETVKKRTMEKIEELEKESNIITAHINQEYNPNDYERQLFKLSGEKTSLLCFDGRSRVKIAAAGFRIVRIETHRDPLIIKEFTNDAKDWHYYGKYHSSSSFITACLELLMEPQTIYDGLMSQSHQSGQN